MRSDSFLVRALVAFLVGISAPGIIFVASHYGANPEYWAIASLCGVLTAAILAGYFELFAKRVWVYGPLLMLPELVAFPVAILTCKGHGCVGSIVLLAVSIPSTFVLIAVSYAAFFIRRKRASATVRVRT